MKEIVYGNMTLQYQLDRVDTEYAYQTITHFYLGVETTTRRKYWLFGEKITVTKPKKVFTLGIDIEDASYSKDEIRNAIKSKLYRLRREEEIAKGEII